MDNLKPNMGLEQVDIYQPRTLNLYFERQGSVLTHTMHAYNVSKRDTINKSTVGL